VRGEQFKAIRFAKGRRMTRRAACPGSCAGLSVGFMALGVCVDIFRSPTGTIVAVCSASASLGDSLRLHFAMMPATHFGMLLAPFILVATDFGRDARNPVGALARAGASLLEMLATEIVVLYLFADTRNPAFMMVAMAGVMGVFACTRSVVAGTKAYRG